MKSTYALALIMAALSCSAAAELYKWVDDAGNVHYSQTRPDADTPVESLKPPPQVQPEAAQNQLEQRKKLLDGYALERQEEKKRKQHALNEQKKAQKNCQRSKALLTQLQRIRKVNITQDNQESLASEETRQEKIKQVQKNISEWCD